MKYAFTFLSLALWFSACGPIAAQDEFLRVHNIEIQLTKTGQIWWSSDGFQTRYELQTKLPHPETLDFIRLGPTNVIHIERYWDAWIVLVQTWKKVATDRCDTNYQGLIVLDSGKVILDDRVRRSSVCPPFTRDRLAFQYVADPHVTKQ